MKKRGGLDSARGGHLLKGLRDALSAESSKPLHAKDHSEPPIIDEELSKAFAERESPKLERVAVKKRSKGPRKEVLHVPRGRKAEFMAAAAATAHSAPIAEPQRDDAGDFGECAWNRIVALRTTLDTFVATHAAPLDVPSDVKKVVERRMELGAAQVNAMADPHDGYFIGHDFGTSTTKAVLRDPYRGPGYAFAVPLPDGWGSNAQPHLWPTALWCDPETGRLSAIPSEGWRCLSGFKSAVVEGRCHRTCGGTGLMMAEAAAAFLAFHVAYLLGTACERDAKAKIAGLNVGIPVASLGNAAIRSEFDKIVRVGLSLLPQVPGLTLDLVKAAWKHHATPPLSYGLFAELSGAIAGYSTAPRHYRGAHMIIDCGSATLDMASFKLADPQWPVGIYCARVERLGADACLTYIAHGATEEECRRASRYLEFEVFRETHARAPGFAQDEAGKFPYQVILTGGGIHSAVHRPLLERMEAAFHRPFHRPALALDLDFDTRVESGRLILADGLARAPIDLREVGMPGDRPSPPPDPHPEMITKDQV